MVETSEELELIQRELKDKINKVEHSDETIVNNFLDSIHLTKEHLNSESSGMDELTHIFERITWLDQLSKVDLLKVKSLLDQAKDLLNKTVNKHYVSLNNKFRNSGIAINELNRYKSAINNFKEMIEDVESALFTLPNIEGFNETTEELNNLK